MPRRKIALYAITMEAERIHRVVRAPHQLGWSDEDYRIWAKKLTYAWGECFCTRSERVVFACSEDLEEVREKLKADGMGNLEAFDDPINVDFDEFNPTFRTPPTHFSIILDSCKLFTINKISYS